MHYIELAIAVCIMGLLGCGVYFTDMAKTEYEVNCETMNLISTLAEVQLYSQHRAWNEKNDFSPKCKVQGDRYTLYRADEQGGEVYYLKHGVRIDTETKYGEYVFQEISLTGTVSNKTLTVYKGSSANKVIIDRVGRIRVKRVDR